jgi:two-component system LytT family sensor kinase
MSDSANSAVRLRARTVVVSIAGLWLCYFTLATLRGWVIGFDLDWPMVSRRIVVTLASMAVTALLWPLLHVLRKRPAWTQWTAVMLAALPSALLLAQINKWTFADIEMAAVTKLGENQGISIRHDEAGNVLVDIPDPAKPGKPGTILLDAKSEQENDWRQITDLALGRYFLLLAWAALYLALLYGEQARAAERREGEYRRAAKAAELRSLRYQINPHFLFNTLNSLSALVVTGRAERAERMIQTLSNFYRASLAEDPMLDHALADEVDQQKRYLEIEALRFPERLRTSFAIPGPLASAQVPGMILQPLIENSVKYGVAESKQAVTIAVEAREEAGELVVTVSDDGPGTGQGGADGFGIGLANVRDRLHARFGPSASVTAGSITGGYRTELRMPLVMGRG